MNEQQNQQPATRRGLVTPTTEALPPGQPTFDVAFFGRAEGFIREQLLLIPELEAVVVIPSWLIQQEAVPFGIIKGRGGPITEAAGQFRLLQQLHSVYASQIRALSQTLKGFDGYAKSLAEEITALEATRNKLRAEVETLTQPPAQQ